MAVVVLAATAPIAFSTAAARQKRSERSGVAPRQCLGPGTVFFEVSTQSAILSRRTLQQPLGFVCTARTIWFAFTFRSERKAVSLL